MKLKNTLILLCSALLLTACNGNTHKHSSEKWERNIYEHWQECECGEKFNISEHTLESDKCSVCKSEIYTYDGGADIYNYNENGDLEKISCYDENGSLLSESITESEYDENGNILKETTYENGELIFITEYATKEDGSSYQKSFTSFSSNGEKSIFEYTDNGFISVSQNYNVEGTLVYEEIYEYEFDANGLSYQSKITQNNYELGTFAVIEMNENGEMVLSSEKDSDGNIIFEDRYDREYDENGNKISEKHYANGKLVYEITDFTYSEDGNWSFPKKEVEYTEDGLTKIFDYNDHGELILEKDYDENGNVIYYFVGEYEYNEDGVMLSKKTYENGSLSTEEYYKITEDGWAYIESETVYYPELDTAYKSTYNEFGDQTGRIIYDGNDNIIQEDIFEIEYDENGNVKSERHYTDGSLTYEAIDYVTDTDGFGFTRYPSVINRYNKDGSKNVTVNGKYGLTKSTTDYAADGSVVTETVYEYEFFESGDLKSVKVIKDGKTIKEEFHETHSEGWTTYLKKEIAYFDDGSTFVTEYDEDMNVISIKSFDADDNEIESTPAE